MNLIEIEKIRNESDGVLTMSFFLFLTVLWSVAHTIFKDTWDIIIACVNLFKSKRNW